MKWIEFIKKNHWSQIGLLIIFPVLIYLQTVKFDYTNFDDNGIILQKYDIVGNISKIDTVFYVDAFFNKTGDFYRPVQNITFMLDAQVSKDKLWMFHITNLCIHILTVISLFYFLRLLQIDKWIAFLISLLFAVHPLFASGVGWVPSRGDILIGLLGLLLFITFHQQIVKKSVTYFLLHSICFLIIIFTKETTILFPALLLFYYFLVLRNNETTNIKKDALRFLPYAIVWLAVLFLYFHFRKGVVANSGATEDVLGIIPFFKNNTVIPTIIGKFFFPNQLSTFPLYNNIDTIIGSIFLLGVVFVTIYFISKKKWIALMALLWFLFFAVPPTIYRLQNADTFFNYLEHRTYLPMIGLTILIALLFNETSLQERIKKYAIWIYIPLVMIFSTIAFVHAGDYKDASTIRKRAAKLNNPSAMAGMAGELLGKGDTLHALEVMNKAISLNAKDASMYYERGKLMARMGNHVEADNDFTMALMLQPNAVDALLARSIERRILKKYEKARWDIARAINNDSTNPRLYNSFGNLLVEVKAYPEAIASFSKAIALQSKFPDPYNNRAYAKILTGDYAGAVADCHSALSLMKEKPVAVVYNNLGRAYRELNNADSAFFYFNKAIATKGNFPEAYFERGIAKQKFNKSNEACEDWKQAMTLGYKDTLNLISKFCTNK